MGMGAWGWAQGSQATEGMNSLDGVSEYGLSTAQITGMPICPQVTVSISL